MILTTTPSFVAAAEPEWQAKPLHQIKFSGLNPNALGDNSPLFNPR